jgi:hypothetical protein
MLKKIVSFYKLKERYGRRKDNAELVLTLTRKEPQCPYRLLNILFSDMLSKGLAQLGNVADLFELDAGKASNNQLFWEGLQEAFTSPSELNDNSHFEDEVLGDLHHINLQKIVLHDCKKLCMIWKNLNTEYKAALTIILCQEPTCQTSMNSVMAGKMYTTCKSIWRPSLTLNLLWLQICQKKCALTAQEDHPQDSPQQAAHRQSVKETRVRSVK